MIPAVLFGFSELSPTLKFIPSFLSIITSMFLHGGWMHLIGNMTYLYIFGDNIEDVMGKIKFIVFYLITGTCAALSQALLDPSSTIPMDAAEGQWIESGAHLMLFPKANIPGFFGLSFFVQASLLLYLYLEDG